MVACGHSRADKSRPAATVLESEPDATDHSIIPVRTLEEVAFWAAQVRSRFHPFIKSRSPVDYLGSPHFRFTRQRSTSCQVSTGPRGTDFGHVLVCGLSEFSPA